MILRRVLVIAGLVLGGGMGFVLGAVLTAPIVGWPHAFPGLLMHAPEPLRNSVAYILLAGGPIAKAAALWRIVLRRVWGL
jgi:hypothetical protein